LGVGKMTSLTFYGGVDEIGGNKILLQDGDTRILLDFGASFALKRQFYSPPFLAPRSERSLRELGMLPEIRGVYRFDSAPAEVDGVVLSHGHLDHSAYLSFIKREIPVYCGETTRIILESLGEVSRSSLEFDVRGIRFCPFRTGRRFKVGCVEVEPIHVDHSVPGAYGFIIHTSAGTVVYTGDFRDHGARPEMTAEFVSKAKASEPVAVITEGTNMTGASVCSEVEVEDKLRRIVSGADGLVVAEFGRSDVDRLNSFYRAAKASGRCLALSMKQAFLIEALRMDSRLETPSLEDEDVWIFVKNKKSTQKWESRLVERYAHKLIDVDDVSRNQCKTVLVMSFYDFEELVALKPAPGSCYVLSASEPFNEEMELDFERLLNWLRHYGLPQYHVHVSGHIMPLQLQSILRTMAPKTVFPVHTEDTGLFVKFMRGLKSRVVHTEKQKEYVLTGG